ncbi:MAG: serine protein kinase RIO, partial [Pseudomonadales bacterium]|nr:serine protein kinase RIO [Pseudomonadales bacterium]
TLRPDSKLSGRFEGRLENADVGEVLRVIEDARAEYEREQARRQAALDDA